MTLLERAYDNVKLPKTTKELDAEKDKTPVEEKKTSEESEK